ncbi:uncharacterized protein LOC126704915 [Quercus robur]|uniref:uncharacterized protein LOC126704915 n=1 Tax=Quercus robur TaxID=38942 RepID=UPI0021626E0B|nr:uncharacterized protein LOC126704915 [Quercus robur]
MILLAWNCRGLAQSELKRSLKAIVNKVCLDLLFLSEVKIRSNRVKALLYSLGFYKLECVEPRGLKGGIILGWKNGVDVEIVMSNDNMINGLVFSDPINEPWLLSLIYGPCARLEKQTFLEDLQKVGESFAGAWLCMGDFNNLLGPSDKKGGKPFSSSSTGGLKGLVDSASLIDVKFVGAPYTWSNKRPGLANIKERLDRALVNTRWTEIFPRALLKHFPSNSFDHIPIVLFTEGEEGSRPRPFKFEETWTREEASNLVVENAWRLNAPGSPMLRLCKKIKQAKLELKQWNRSCFGNVQSKIKEAWKNLDQIQCLDPNPQNLEKEANLCMEIQELLKREEILWHQKSRIKSLTSSDLNT